MRWDLAFAVVSLSCAAALADDSVLPGRRGQFPKTRDDVHLEMVFNTVLCTEGRLGDESGVVDVVWGSCTPNQPPGVYNSSYMPFFVDNRAGFDVAWYQAHHPDWLAYKCDRVTLAYLDDKHQPPLDFANPAVQAYQWSVWVDGPLSQGYPSIAIDLLHLTNNFGRCGHFDGSNWVQEYNGETDQAKYRHDVLAWESATYKHIHGQTPTATMQVNVSYDPDESLADNQKLMTTTDLLFDERGFTNYGNIPNYPTPELWEAIREQILYDQSQKVCYMINGEEPSDDITPDERQWAIGNYLLVRDNCTYMYMTGQQDYGDLVTFFEYGKHFGHPTGDMQLTQGAWERPYSKGLTLVDPFDSGATVDLPPGSWVDVNGNPVSSPVNLAPHTALLLLKAPG
jgi:hypothetical protein